MRQFGGGNPLRRDPASPDAAVYRRGAGRRCGASHRLLPLLTDVVHLPEHAGTLLPLYLAVVRRRRSPQALWRRRALFKPDEWFPLVSLCFFFRTVF